MIVVNKKLVPKGYTAMAIFPFIFLKEESFINNVELINHEKIHLKQQLELLIVFFYVWYGIEFLIKWIKLKDSKKAYYNISFEKEAYENESNLNYLKNRKKYNWIECLKIHR